MYYVETIYTIAEIKYLYIYDIVNTGFCADTWRRAALI